MRIAHYLHVDKRLKSFRMGADMSQKRNGCEVGTVCSDLF